MDLWMVGWIFFKYAAILKIVWDTFLQWCFYKKEDNKKETHGRKKRDARPCVSAITNY